MSEAAPPPPVEVVDCFGPGAGPGERPQIIWSFAMSIDGRSAAADGTSRWISNPAALRDTHRLRSQVDAVLVGTNTAVIDDPALTARDEAGRPLPRQPLRVVMGNRDLPAGLQLFNGAWPTLWLRTRDPRQAVAELAARGCRSVLLEGGPTLAAGFLGAGLVDEVIVYLAPMLLGAGRSAVADFGVATLGSALHAEVTDIAVLGESDAPNLRITFRPRY